MTQPKSVKPPTFHISASGKQNDIGSIPLRLFREKLWSVGTASFVTLSLTTINETLKWLSSLPILNAGIILVVVTV